MGRSWKYRVLAYLVLIVVAGVSLVPSVADWLHRSSRVPQWFTKRYNRKIVPGTDLRGGKRWVYTVNIGKIAPDQLMRYADSIKNEFAKRAAQQKASMSQAEYDKLPVDKKIQPVNTQVWGQDQEAELHVFFASSQEAKLMDPVEKELGLLARLVHNHTLEKPTEVVYRMHPDYFERVLKGEAFEQIIRIIKERVDSSGVGEVSVQRYNSSAANQDAVVVEIAGDSELMDDTNQAGEQKISERLQRIKELIEKTAHLEFRIVQDSSEYAKKLAAYAESKKAQYPGLETESHSWVAKADGNIHTDEYVRHRDQKQLEKFVDELPAEYKAPLGYQLLLGQTKREGQADRFWRTFYVVQRADITGDMLVDARYETSQETQTFGQAEVAITFSTEGGALFQKLTRENVGRKLAIVMDNKVISDPEINVEIAGGRGRITLGGADPKTAEQEGKELESVLRAGALPVPLAYSSGSSIGASLGPEVVHKARIAMMVGLSAVVLFMLVYYRLSGLVASIAMVINLLLLLSLLALFQAVLTLPGIAAVVLTIGMAVDANIIIYERIREELRAGRSARGAVEAGFNRAFWTVFDAHVTNLIAGVVLYSYGTGPIRGFAVSLMAGVVCNLFTSVWLSRAFFEWMVGRKKNATLSI